MDWAQVTSLWRGKKSSVSARFLRLWSNKEAGTASEVSLANQLMGDWCGHVLGLEDALPGDRAAKALEAVERLNLGATSYGLINGVSPDGKPYDSKVHPLGDHNINILVCDNLLAAMTFVYHSPSFHTERQIH